MSEHAAYFVFWMFIGLGSWFLLVLLAAWLSRISKTLDEIQAMLRRGV